MLSEISSFLDLFKFIYEGFAKKPIKSVFTLLIVLSIVLIKPIAYYSTLYIDFCKFSSTMFSIIVLFLFLYKLYRHRTHEDYDKDTVNHLIGINIFVIILIIVGIFKHNNAFLNIFSNQNIAESIFIDNIHKKEYFQELYNYVQSNFLPILLYSIEFIQAISISYLYVYIISKLLLLEAPLKYGLLSKNFETIIINVLIIFLSSPVLYEPYSLFWNKIF